MHWPLRTAATTLASTIEEPQTERSKPETGTQVLLFTVWYKESGTETQSGQDQTGRRQLLSSSKARAGLAWRFARVPKMLFRFELKDCNDLVSAVPSSAVRSPWIDAEVGIADKVAATSRNSSKVGPQSCKLCLPRMVPLPADTGLKLLEL